MKNTAMNTPAPTPHAPRPDHVAADAPLSDAVQQALAISRRGVDELLPEHEWVQKLLESEKTGRALRIKLGLDPTAPDIHLGHTVVLNKMRQLQDLGHEVIFLIGDFTTLIGDPSGRNTTRPPLTAEQIQVNAQTYCDQAFKVLDASRTQIRYNSQWCDALGTRGLINLSAKYTVARMMERNDFAQRFEQGSSISLHEFLYPLLQGYDSVALQADLELGGTDQKFNLMMGRHLQQEWGQTPQCVLTMPLLVGLDGVHKMSKSKNNYIGITENANTMFAKVLSISDDLMWDWFTLLSFQTESDIAKLRADIQNGRNPKEAKTMLAHEITARFHGAAVAEAARADFELRARGGVPDVIDEVHLTGAPLGIGALLKQANLAPSTSEAGRLIDGGGVRVDGGVISDRGLKLPAGTYVVQVGKRKFARITLSA